MWPTWIFLVFESLAYHNLLDGAVKGVCLSCFLLGSDVGLGWASSAQK